MSDDDSVLWLLTSHFALLSLMAIGGGVIALAPDMHRYVVETHHWITSEQFAAAYTLAQAAPGPNMLFVTLVGWQIAGWAGALGATAAIVVPPAVITILLMRASTGRGIGRFGRALRNGVAPLSVGMLLATAWVLARSVDADWRGAALTLVTIAILQKAKFNPLWLIGAGAVAGVAGVV